MKAVFLTVYINKPGGADGMVPMKPLEAGGYEASLYTSFLEAMAKAHPAVSVISFGTADGGYMQYPAVPRKTGYDSRSRDWYKDTVQEPDKLLLADPFLTSKGVPTIGILLRCAISKTRLKVYLDLTLICQLSRSCYSRLSLGIQVMLFYLTLRIRLLPILSIRNEFQEDPGRRHCGVL